jgi:hypothetical protein
MRTPWSFGLHDNSPLVVRRRGRLSIHPARRLTTAWLWSELLPGSIQLRFRDSAERLDVEKLLRLKWVSKIGRGGSPLVCSSAAKHNRNAYRATALAGLALILGVVLVGQAYPDAAFPDDHPGQPQAGGAQSLLAPAPQAGAPQEPRPCSPHGAPGPFSTDCRETVAAEKSARFTLAAAIIAGAQLVALIGQIIALIITIRESHTATRAALDSVEASQRSAKAAEDAVAKSDEMLLHERDSAFRIERAYVYALTNSDNIADAVNNTLSGDHDPTKAFKNTDVWIKVAFKNYGKTPARLQEGTLHLQISETQDNPPRTYAVDVTCHYPLAAGEESTAIYLEIPDCLSIHTCRAIDSGVARISLSGSVPYKDIWGNDQTCLLFWKYDFRSKSMVPDGSIQYDI